MPISPRSARTGRDVAGALLLAATLGAPALAALAAPAPSAPAPAAPVKASAAEALAAGKRLPAVLAGRAEFADGMVVSPAQKIPLWSAREGDRLLVPVYVRYPGERSGYCRLATLSRDLREATLIDVPEDINAPDCKGFRALRYLQVNADGRLDLVASMTVKSNSVDGDVEVPVVYLSNPGQAGGYCYSAAASAVLQPLDMGSDDKLRQAFQKGKRRLHGAEFACGATR